MSNAMNHEQIEHAATSLKDEQRRLVYLHTCTFSLKLHLTVRLHINILPFVEIKETVSRKKSSIRRLNTGPRYCFTFLESSVEELQFFKMAPSFYKSCELISWNLLLHAYTPNGVRPELAIYMF